MMKRIVLGLMLFLFSVSYSFAASPVIKVLDPNGGEAIASGTIYGIDFNVLDADADELFVSLYYTEYSEGAGSYQYVIVKDWNATNSQNCPNYSVSSTEYTCTWNWDTNKYYTDVSDANLLMYFPMDYNVTSEGYITDYSHNDWNAVNLIGSAVQGSDFNTTDCVDGNCRRFYKAGGNDAGNSIKAEQLINVSYEEGTFMGWFKPDSWNSYEGLMSYVKENDITYGSIQLQVVQTGGGAIYFTIYDQDHAAKCSPTFNVTGYTGWHHLAATWKNNGTCVLYVDGVQRSSGAITNANMNYSPLHYFRIGDNGSYTYNYDFNGNADEVKVYSRQLSGTEVMADYNRLKVADNRYYLDANVMDGWNGTKTTDSSNGEFAIGSGTVIIKVPKDEKTLANISTFDVRVIGTLSQDFNGLTADKNVVISIGEDYRIIVDSNEEGYYQRNYYVHLTETDESITIQPYLPDQTNGLLVWMYLIDPNTNQRIPDILIRVYKSISGYGTVEVESIKTDSSGAANLAFIALDTYTIKYYDGDTLLKTDTLNPSSTTYYSYIDTGTITTPDTNMSVINVTFTPNRYLYPPTDDANVSIDVNISITTGDGNAVWIYARQLNRVIYSLYDNNILNVASGANYSFDLNQSDLNSWIPVRVQAIISTTKQTQAFFTSYEVMKTGEHEWDINASVAGFIGEAGHFGAIMVMLFIYLGIMIGSTRFLQVNPSGGAAIGAGIFAIATYLGIVPLWITAIIIALVPTTWMLSR